MFKDVFVTLIYDHALEVTSIALRKFNLNKRKGNISMSEEKIIPVNWTVNDKAWQRELLAELSTVKTIWFVNLTRERQALVDLVGELFISKKTEACYKAYIEIFTDPFQHLPKLSPRLNSEYCITNMQHLYVNYRWSKEDAA